MQTNPTFLKKLSLVVMTTAIFSVSLLRAQSHPTLPANQLITGSKTHTISFYWQGDSIHSKWEPHAAILIPIKLKNCPRKFYMQFDLGSPYSLLYKNKIESIQMKYPKAVLSKEAGGVLRNFLFKTAGTPILAKEIIVKQFDSTVVEWNNKKGIEIIGTIGADLIENKVLIIDYLRCKLTISTGIPEKLAKQVSLTDFTYSNRSILLPATVKDKTTILYFDTGSSMFELLTDKETCNQLAKPDTMLIQYKVKSWNKFLTANTMSTNEQILLANTKIRLHSTTYIEGITDAQIKQMSKLGIGGMIGNKLFLNHILVLDTKNKKFGLTKSF